MGVKWNEPNKWQSTAIGGYKASPRCTECRRPIGNVQFANGDGTYRYFRTEANYGVWIVTGECQFCQDSRETADAILREQMAEEEFAYMMYETDKRLDWRE